MTNNAVTSQLLERNKYESHHLLSNQECSTNENISEPLLPSTSQFHTSRNCLPLGWICPTLWSVSHGSISSYVSRWSGIYWGSDSHLCGSPTCTWKISRLRTRYVLPFFTKPSSLIPKSWTYLYPKCVWPCYPRIERHRGSRQTRNHRQSFDHPPHWYVEYCLKFNNYHWHALNEDCGSLAFQDDEVRADLKKRVPEKSKEIEGMSFGAITE